MLSEFNVIERFFARPTSIKKASTVLGIGDDCALLSIPEGYELALTTDTMVEGVHFFAETNPEHLGHKLLAVNLSDLASIGAQPMSVLLALTLPRVNEEWLEAFAKGFFSLADEFSVDLIGGDTTSGSLTLTVQALGLVARGKSLLRSNARVGDFIYVSGSLGNAGLGLLFLQGKTALQSSVAMTQFNTPHPRVDLGLKISIFAHACIDISDGLVGDLGHILKQSQVGACIDWLALPLSDDVRAYIQQTGDWLMPLTAGDDYELCFTVPPELVALVPQYCHKIGVIEERKGLRINRFGLISDLVGKAYEHFS